MILVFKKYIIFNCKILISHEVISSSIPRYLTACFDYATRHKSLFRDIA